MGPVSYWIVVTLALAVYTLVYLTVVGTLLWLCIYIPALIAGRLRRAFVRRMRARQGNPPP